MTRYQIIPIHPRAATHTLRGIPVRVIEIQPGTIIEGPNQPIEAANLAALEAMALIPIPPKPTPPKRPFAMSKLKLLRQLAALNLLDGFLAMLDTIPNARLFFDAAQVLSTDDPLVLAAVPQFQSATGISAADLSALFSSCREP